jgi:hypothetical protein
MISAADVGCGAGEITRVCRFRLASLSEMSTRSGVIGCSRGSAALGALCAGLQDESCPAARRWAGLQEGQLLVWEADWISGGIDSGDEHRSVQ